MTAFNFIVFILLLWFLRNLFFGLLAWRRSHQIRKVRQKEVTQRFFAEARNELMSLVLRGEIIPSSVTFRFFYFLDTFVMRRPNDYEKISMMLRSSLGSDENSNTKIIQDLLVEKKGWTINVKSMVSMQTDALNHLIVSHSFILRNLCRVAPAILPILKLIISTVDVWEKVKKRIAENDKGFVHNVYRSEKNLEILLTT